MNTFQEENPQIQSTCPECGAVNPPGSTCQDYFHQLLYWENDDPTKASVHPLLVLAFHLQHPSRLSPAGLSSSIKLLVDFLEYKIPPEQALKKHRPYFDSSHRQWKIRARPGAVASYLHPIVWRITIQDVVSAGAGHYIESVQSWVSSIIADLRSTQNLV